MPNEDVEIRVFGSRAEYADADSRDEGAVAEIVRDHVLPGRDAEYERVDVQVVRRPDQAPDHLVAYLLRKDVYMAEVVRIDVESNFTVGAVTYDYDDSDEDDDDGADGAEFVEWDDPELDDAFDAEISSGDDDADYAVEFVAATPVPSIQSAKAAVEELHKMASAAGLNSVMLLGPQASVANYKKYLTAGLKGFVNIGHGNTNSIALHDGPLRASWFASLPSGSLTPEVVYFNSCQVFNQPLQPAVMAAGARSFIGGIVNLLIGPSEKVCTCYWKSCFTTQTAMEAALKTCEQQQYPSQGAHGISGDKGPFGLLKLRLVDAAWTHGHGLVIEHPERIAFDRPYGMFMRLRGKPFQGTWVHFQIPTPVIADGQRLRAGSVLLRFRTGPGAAIGAVHVWDGSQRIAAHDGLNLTSSGVTTRRFGVPSSPKVYWGLGISVNVKFGDDANLPANKLLVDFVSAGCDFVELI